MLIVFQKQDYEFWLLLKYYITSDYWIKRNYIVYLYIKSKVLTSEIISTHYFSSSSQEIIFIISEFVFIPLYFSNRIHLNFSYKSLENLLKFNRS